VIWFIAWYAGAPFVLAACAYIAEHVAAEHDDDLEWVNRQIDRTENAGGGPDETADMREQRRLYLERLYKVRDRLEGKP
jgi:hypothetical protein